MNIYLLSGISTASDDRNATDLEELDHRNYLELAISCVADEAMGGLPFGVVVVDVYRK